MKKMITLLTLILGITAFSLSCTDEDQNNIKENKETSNTSSLTEQEQISDDIKKIVAMYPIMSEIAFNLQIENFELQEQNFELQEHNRDLANLVLAQANCVQQYAGNSWCNSFMRIFLSHPYLICFTVMSVASQIINMLKETKSKKDAEKKAVRHTEEDDVVLVYWA